MKRMPAAVAALPKIMQDVIKRQCGGDWSRVTVDDGVAVVHNAPSTALRPAVRSYRRLELPEAQPKVVRAPRKRVEPPAPEAPIDLAATADAVVAERAKSDAEFRRVNITTVDKKPEGWTPERPVLLPGNPQGDSPYSGMGPDEILTSAHKLAQLVAKGVGDVVPLIMYHGVLETSGLDIKEAEGIVRHCTSVEIRPESVAKGYPILRFRNQRSDVSVVVGFRNPREPSILRIDQGSLLVHDKHRVNHMGGGGGGKRKSQGVPYRPETIRAGLIRLGCEVPEFAGGPVEVIYKEGSLGKIPERIDDKQLGERIWQTIHRRWDARMRKLVGIQN